MLRILSCLRPDAFEFVSVYSGKIADFILVDDNPFEDVANVARRTGVMLRGRWLPESELQAMLEELATSYAAPKRRFADMPPRKPQPGRPHLDIGYIGSISRHKGVHVLLEALEHVDDDRLRVHIYGRRHSQPGFSEGLIDHITDSRVTFHGPEP